MGDPAAADVAVESPELKPHISASQISKYRTCPRQWRYHYIDKLKRVPNDNLIIGSGMHAGIEFNLRQKIETKKDCDPEDSKAAAVEATRALAGDGFVSWDGLTINDIEQQVIYLVDAHHRLVAPSIQPAYVEHAFRVHLGDDFPVDLLGFIDVITTDGLVIDHKSWGKAKYQAWVDKDMQATAYSFAYRSTFQQIERGIRFDAILKKSYRYAPLSTTRNNTQIRWWLRQIEDIVAAMQAGNDWPNNDTFLCNERYCDYWSICQQSLV